VKIAAARVRIAPEQLSAVLVVMAMSCSSEGDQGSFGGNGGSGGSGATGAGAAGGFGGTAGAGGSGVGGSGPGGSGGVGGGGGLAGSGGIGATGGIAGTGGAGGSGGSGVGGSAGTACTAQPPGAVSDYGARGPFAVTQVNNTGPSGQYTMFRPTDLNTGFKHPPTTWGNGLSTTPAAYVALLTTVASHGFVVIASNSTGITAQQVRSGLEWLIAQNDVAGDFQGKLVVDCASAIGYSMGGGAATTASAHPAVKAIVSMHGLQASSGSNPAPLLLMTSTDDTFVTKAANAQPSYNRASAQQPTILATLNCPAAGMDYCLSISGIGGHAIPLDNAHGDRAPLVAWLRYWIYGDLGARGFFFGPDCTLCKDPWLDIQRKNYAW
jgi:hypothetical protein